MDLFELRLKPHLSASAISDYLDCGLRYKFGRIDRLQPEFIADSLEFGTVIHRVLAQYYAAKMVGDRMLLKDIRKLFKKLWTDAAKDRDDIRYAEGKDFETLLMLGVDLLTAWYSKIEDYGYRILAIEEAFSFDLPNLPVPIVGAMDLVEEDESGTIVITDFKTSGKAYSADEIDRNMQMTLYQLAAKSNGFADREILLKFDCLIKTQTPKFEQYYTVRTEVDEKRLIKKIGRVWEGILRGVFIPNDTGWKHNNCPYRKVCDEWFLQGGDS
jgi:putative RecB family exonuclease